MGEPVGKASGRTFNQMSTQLSDTCWSSLSVTSSHPLNMSIQSPSAALKSGLTAMAVYSTVGYHAVLWPIISLIELTGLEYRSHLKGSIRRIAYFTHERSVFFWMVL